jgi:hypothetical protein
MPVARNPGSSSLVDILDRVLDQGLRFEPGPRAPPSSAGTPVQKGRIVVTAAETHLERSEGSAGKTESGA